MPKLNSAGKQNRKIRLLEFGSPGELYGAERWILALITHLDTAVIDTMVVSLRDDPELRVPLCVEADQLGFPIKIFECYGKVNFNALRQLRQYILDNDINIIHTHHYKTDILGLLATRGTSCRIVSTPHGWSKHVDLKLWCYEMLDRCIFTFMDAVVPLSHELYCSLKKIPGLLNKLHYIQNGVDISEVMGEEKTNSDLQALRDDGVFIIGYIGQLIPRKGLDVLLQALSKLNSFEWRLVLIGEGDQQPELHHMALEMGVEEKVVFYGFRADRLSFLKGFDVFVLPSRQEGIPRCLMEAMTAGVPVIASDITGCNDLVSHMETGLLFSMDDSETLKGAIEMLASDPELRERLKRNGHSLIEEKFSAARMADEYTKLFWALTEKK